MKYLSFFCFRRWACEPDIPICRVGTRSTPWRRAEDLHWRYSRSRALTSTQSFGLLIEDTEVSSHSISGSFLLLLILFVWCFSINLWLVVVQSNMYLCMITANTNWIFIEICLHFQVCCSFFVRDKRNVLVFFIFLIIISDESAYRSKLF